MADHVIHISETAANDFAGLLAWVRAGADVVCFVTTEYPDMVTCGPDCSTSQTELQ
jgi:hypothetical protein